MDFTCAGLIEQVSRKSSIPDNQTLYTDSDLINFLNEELQNKIVPYIASIMEDYFLAEKSYLADGSTKEYLIPPDSIGSKIKSVSVWNDGIQLNQQPRLDYNNLVSTVHGYYIFNNKIIFYPKPIMSNTIKISYYKRPNNITDLYYKITAISSDSVSTTLTIDVDPTALSNGTSIDIVSKNSPFVINLNTNITSTTSATIVIPLTTLVNVGDYVSLEGSSAFPQIPQEIIPLLVQAVEVRIMESMGDYNAFQASAATYQQMAMDNMLLISNRNEYPVRKIKNVNKIRNWIM
jgi:hypothetical protein